MKKYLLILFSVFILNCTDAKTASRVLDENGYTEVEMTGYNFFACSREDFYHTGFIAVSSNGRSVEGTVCSGLLFKNSTIRFK